MVGGRTMRADYGGRAPRSSWLLLSWSSKLIPVSPELSQATGAHAPSNVKSPQSKVLINNAPALGAVHIAYQHSYDKHAFCLTRAAWCAPDYCLSREHALPRCGWHTCFGISITTSVHVRATLAPSNPYVKPCSTNTASLCISGHSGVLIPTVYHSSDTHGACASSPQPHSRGRG